MVCYIIFFNSYLGQDIIFKESLGKDIFFTKNYPLDIKWSTLREVLCVTNNLDSLSYQYDPYYK